MSKKNTLSDDEKDYYMDVLGHSGNYSKIQSLAIELLKKEGCNQLDNLDSIKVICNPYRHWGFPNEKDEGLEKYFDIELVYGSKYPEISDRFKKAFVKALGMLFEAEIF